jgi:hypothetical protein
VRHKYKIKFLTARQRVKQQRFKFFLYVLSTGVAQIREVIWTPLDVGRERTRHRLRGLHGQVLREALRPVHM